MTYATEIAAIDREVIWLLKVTLDYCDNTYGVAPCTASGGHCYYTRPTCKDTANYAKSTAGRVYEFCSRGAHVSGAKPLLFNNFKTNPTEINPEKFTTERGKMTFTLAFDTAGYKADPAKSVGEDDTGNFWPNFRKRNLNYKGRLVELYHGFKGLDPSLFELKFRGLIDNFTIDSTGAKISAYDMLYKAVEVKTPAKIPTEITLAAGITNVATTLNLDNDGDTTFNPGDYFEVADYDSGSSTVNQYRYMKIGDEIIAYTTLVGDTSTTAQITGMVRGVMGTTAASHSLGDEITQVSCWGIANASDANWAAVTGIHASHIFLDILCNLSGVAASYLNYYTDGTVTVNGAHAATVTSIAINNGSELPSTGVIKINDELIRYTANSGTALTVLRGCYGTTAAAHANTDAVTIPSFSYWLDEYSQGFIYKGWYEKPVKAKDLMNTLRRCTLLNIWQNEDGEVEARLAVPYVTSAPPTYTHGTDIVFNSHKVDFQESSRLTRVNLYYKPAAADPGDKAEDYETGGRNMIIDLTREDADYYGEVKERSVFCPWIYRENEASVIAKRLYVKYLEAVPRVDFGLELKDSSVKTGDLIQLTIPEVVDEDGAEETLIYEVVRKVMASAGRWALAAVNTGFAGRRYPLISDDTDTYDASSYSKTIYGWIGNADNEVGAAGDDGYYIF